MTAVLAEPALAAPPWPSAGCFVRPELRRVALDAIFPHEMPDLRRSEHLRPLLEQQGFLAHPVLVADLGRARGPHQYLQLDGANRLHVLRELGYDFTLA